MKHRLWVVAAVGLIGCLAIVSLALAGGGYTLSSWVAASGGAALSAGGYGLAGTVGQGEVGSGWSGGPYTLAGGFWQAPPAAGHTVYLPLLKR